MKKKLFLVLAAMIITVIFAGCAEEYVKGGINKDGMYENEIAGFTYEFPDDIIMLAPEEYPYRNEVKRNCDFAFTTVKGDAVTLVVETMPIAAYPTDVYAKDMVEDLKYDFQDTSKSVINVKPLELVKYGGVSFDRFEFTVSDEDTEEEIHYILLLKSAGDRMVSFTFVGKDKDDFDDLTDGFDFLEKKDEE